MTYPKLHIVPIMQAEAFAFVRKHHRHHGAPVGSIFQVAAANAEGEVVGVAIVGRPVARMLQDGWTLEVNRLCTDGAPNACSMLYAAAWRVAKGLGYRRLITYILNTEGGTSLQAAGWRKVGEAGGGTWDREERPRVDTHPIQKKILFEASQ